MNPLCPLHRPPRWLLAALAIALASPESHAQTVSQREPTLRERLTAGLQVRRPSEAAFVNAVVDTVDREELDEQLVNRVFFWARGRPGRKGARRRPIVYFQAAIQRLAKDANVRILTDLDAIAARSAGR